MTMQANYLVTNQYHGIPTTFQSVAKSFVAYFTKEVNPSVAEPYLKFIGNAAKFVLPVLIK